VRAHRPCSWLACNRLFRAQIEKEITALEFFIAEKEPPQAAFFMPYCYFSIELIFAYQKLYISL
jgi:hypothetical protein